MNSKYFIRGHAVAQFVETLRYKPGRLWDLFPIMSLEIFIDIIPAAVIVALGVNSACNRNE
jgi:hypothetical protein